jgi:transmembrane sensor
MDSLPTYDNFPWELIVAALQDKLAPDEELTLRQWLGEKEENREHYERLQQMWKEGLTDYTYYREADEGRAWDALQQRIGGGRAIGGELAIGGGRAIAGERAIAGMRAIGGTREIGGERFPVMGRWMAAAAVFLLLAGAGWWYFSQLNAPLQYETASEQKNMALPDGSSIVIGSRTRIRIARDYNKTGRTVILDIGKAEFAVAHQAQLPFTVDVDVASIKDIGTTFAVQKTTDSILVTVTSGKVAFIQKATGESREVAAGRSLAFYPAEHRFGEMRPAHGFGDLHSADSGTDSMRFINAPLSGVVAALRGVFDKKITLNDSALGRKTLTADLTGVSFADAMKIVCASLNLDYAEKNGSFILSAKDSSAHKH